MTLLLAYAAGVLTGVLCSVLTAAVVVRVIAPRRRSLVATQAAADVAAVRGTAPPPLPGPGDD